MFADATKVYDSGRHDRSDGDEAGRRLDRRSERSCASSSPTAATTSTPTTATGRSARIECGGGDTTPPTITAQTPAPRRNGVAVNVSPTATFSEAMNAATLTTSTFTLVKQGAVDAVAATRLLREPGRDPRPERQPASRARATRRPSRAARRARRTSPATPLAADVSWSFTTAAGANQPPTPVIDTPASTLTWKVGDPISFSRPCDRPRAGHAPRLGALLDAPPPALPLELPHAHDPELAGGRERLVRRTRSRVPVVPRAAADRHRRRAARARRRRSASIRRRSS